jgi:excinuclease ABC subunit C
MDVPRTTGALPQRPGVYRFRDRRDRVLYVGRAADLRSRVRSYWGSLPERRHLRRMVSQVDRIEAIVCQSRHEAAWLERSVLEHRMPRWNRTPGGQELPVWLRVTDLGVALEHRHVPGDVFGPYLGAVQARCAADALDRIYPVRYSTTRTGAERDMARIRGVTPADGPRLHASIVKTLTGDPVGREAAFAALVRRRQTAVDALDFERAATIQRELNGLAWILEPSRVVDGGPDVDIHGWADGTLLTFELRNGRILDWVARASSEADAAPLVASTPDDWHAFTRENAALAAALRAGNVRAEALGVVSGLP